MVIGNSYDYVLMERVSASKRQTAVERTDSVTSGQSFSKLLGEKRENDFPYGSYAKDGIIEYNGVVFVGDAKTNSISLGDVSDPRKVLNISLPSGGNLKVNVNNLEELSKAAGMFSAEDLNAILRAVEQYKHCASKLKELDDMKNEIGESAESSNVEDEVSEAQEVKEEEEV